MKPKMPFYEQLTHEEKQLFDSNLQLQHYARGQMIHRHDGNCLGMFCVDTGRIGVSMLSDEGRQVTLIRREEGDFCVLAAACVIRQITFEVSVEAETDTDVWMLPAQVTSALMKSNAQFENFVLRTAMTHFSDVMWTMQQILFLGYDRRLASFLTEECARTGGTVLTLTQEQIAKYTGTVREVVTRMLKRFAAEGYVRLGRGTVTVLNKNALRQLV